MKNNIILFLSLFFFISVLNGYALDENNISLDVYNINFSNQDDSNVVEKGSLLNLILLNDVSTDENTAKAKVDFKVCGDDGLNLKAVGNLTASKSGGRFSMFSSIGFTTDKLYLDDGQEVNFISSSPLFQATHSPHANTNSLAITRAITGLSLAASPLTLGASFGISFLASGILSASQNGISDFVWGGLTGSGLSFLENIFRKQPDVFLEKGTIIPFTLKEDLKISKSVTKEMDENLKLSKEGAIKRIQKLLEWGDLAGALELSAKSEQKETYNNLMKKLRIEN